MCCIEFFSRSKRLLVGVLLLILSAYYVNSSMCYHQHTIMGETIFHSHFYSSEHTSDCDDTGAPGDGGHTLDMIKLIAALNNITLEEQGFDHHIEPTENIIESKYKVLKTAEARRIVDDSRSLRAPPIFSII